MVVCIGNIILLHCHRLLLLLFFTTIVSYHHWFLLPLFYTIIVLYYHFSQIFTIRFFYLFLILICLILRFVSEWALMVKFQLPFIVSWKIDAIKIWSTYLKTVYCNNTCFWNRFNCFLCAHRQIKVYKTLKLSQAKLDVISTIIRKV